MTLTLKKRKRILEPTAVTPSGAVPVGPSSSSGDAHAPDAVTAPMDTSTALATTLMAETPAKDSDEPGGLASLAMDSAADRDEADYGCRYHCDSCQKDISGLARIHCAECPEFDLCVGCFCGRVEVGGHRMEHRYRVMDMLDFPLFETAWCAEEELLLIEGLELYGMGNWTQVAEHVNSKSAAQCCRHYASLYSASPAFPLPVSGEEISGVPVSKPPIFFKRMHSRADYHAALAAAAAATPPQPRQGPPLQSQPLRHDVSGFMPARGDFDAEYDNDAEVPVKDLVFEEGDSRDERELKLTMLDIYNTTLDRRLERKKFLFQRKLIDIKRQQAIDKKMDKETREMYFKYRVFAKMMTQSDFDDFMQAMIQEQRLKRRIAELQTYIRVGVRNYKQEQEYRLARKSREQVLKELTQSAAGGTTDLTSALARQNSRLSFTTKPREDVRLFCRLIFLAVVPTDVVACRGAHLESDHLLPPVGVGDHGKWAG